MGIHRGKLSLTSFAALRLPLVLCSYVTANNIPLYKNIVVKSCSQSSHPASMFALLKVLSAWCPKDQILISLFCVCVLPCGVLKAEKILDPHQTLQSNSLDWLQNMLQYPQDEGWAINIVPMGCGPFLMLQKSGSMDFSAVLTYTTADLTLFYQLSN